MGKARTGEPVKYSEISMGRPLGALNKKTAQKLEEIAKTGELPLDYMLRIMRDPTQDHTRRDEMAKAAASYVHPRLTNVESKTETTVRYVARVPDNSQTIVQRHASDLNQTDVRLKFGPESLRCNRSAP